MWASSGTTNTFPRCWETQRVQKKEKNKKNLGTNGAQPSVIVPTGPKAQGVVRSRVGYDFMVLSVHLLSCGIGGQENPSLMVINVNLAANSSLKPDSGKANNAARLAEHTAQGFMRTHSERLAEVDTSQSLPITSRWCREEGYTTHFSALF